MKQKFTIREQCRLTKSRVLQLIAAILLFTGFGAHAQIPPAGSYSFTQTSGTYTPITGGTVLNSTVPDSWTSGAVTLSPGFTFCGVTYTTAYVTSNGLITLGGSAPSSTEYNGIANTTGSGVALAVFNADLRNSTVTGVASNIRYQLVGNEHVFQWQDACRWTTQSTERMSFQARLNHVTGEIKYIYNVSSVATSTSYQPIVGIRTASTAGNWQSRTVANNASSSWAASTAATATTDVCRFTSSTTNPKQPDPGQTYIFTPPPPCNTLTTLPTAGTVTASPATICMSGNVTMNFTPSTPMPPTTGITYKWQSATAAGGPYTDIPGGVTNAPTYTTTTPITTSSYFRCVVLCNGTTTVLTSSASNQVVVNNPGVPTVTGASRCGPGTVTLSATPPSGATINWYQNATGGAPLATGNTFSTGYLPTTTTFYAAAASGSSPGSGWVGNGTSYTSSQPNPFYSTFMTNKIQFLVKASELIALGLGSGTVNSIAFDVGTVTGATNPINIGDTIFNLSISMKTTAVNDLTTTFETGLTPCYSNTAYVPQANAINTFNFSSPFPWDGVSNVIVEVCFAGPAWGGSKNVKYTTGLSFQASHYQYTDNNIDQCTAPAGTNATTTSRPNIQFNMTLGCTGPRQPVVATINPSPVVTRTSPPVVCSDGVATIALTPPSSPYPSYTWSPVPIVDLYTNPAGTTPYVAGNSATTVYMRSTTVGQHTYYMMAGNPAVTTGCTYADTVRIWVQPDSVTIAGQPDTICVSGSTTLSLVPNTGYYPNTIQWQSSTNGTTYTDIAGATNATYVTPTLNFGQNTYYRALIKAGTANCQVPVKYVVIANPTVISASDSFNCGPGTVTLNVTTGGNGSAVWYENATGGLPIATGSPFVTPYLGTTTTYYVSAGGGGSAGTETIGAGALSGSGSYSPFTGGWGGRKHQFLIKASELLAAGIPPGANLSSLAFDVTAGAGTTYPGFTISMKATTVNDLSGGYQTGLTEVRAPSDHTIANGLNTMMFDTYFPWDGTSNIVVQTCWSNGTATSNYGSVKYDNIPSPNNSVTRYTQQDNQTPATICGLTGGTTVTQRPQITFGYDNRCESPRQAVTAYIRPVPVVDLGNDINECVDAGQAVVLDAGLQPDNGQYLWDNGSTLQVRSVSQSGTYSVEVTNQYTCKDADTISVILRHNPEVELGNDTTVCNGATLTLDAGNQGIEYFWNTGAVTQEIVVNDAGTYNVFVTNNQGCVGTDTITVNMQGELPSIQGIMVTNDGQNTFQFTAVNPQNVIGYDWDFGDGSPHSYQASPTHTYDSSGNYIVVLKLSSSCGFLSDSSAAHIVGVHQLNVDKNELTVYPNPAKSTATILNRGVLKMEQVVVYNVLGQVVYRSKSESRDKHELRLDGLASGVYTIEVFTDKGTVARKLEIVR